MIYWFANPNEKKMLKEESKISKTFGSKSTAHVDHAKTLEISESTTCEKIVHRVLCNEWVLYELTNSCFFRFWSGTFAINRHVAHFKWKIWNFEKHNRRNLLGSVSLAYLWVRQTYWNEKYLFLLIYKIYKRLIFAICNMWYVFSLH